MLHARSDYDHIQDPTGKVGEDEPVFLLRAKDILAPNAIRHWAALLLNSSGDNVTYDAAMKHAERMEDWQSENEHKLPDTPAEVVK